jgi:hypothetical protein
VWQAGGQGGRGWGKGAGGQVNMYAQGAERLRGYALSCGDCLGGKLHGDLSSKMHVVTTLLLQALLHCCLPMLRKLS